RPAAYRALGGDPKFRRVASGEASAGARPANPAAACWSTRPPLPCVPHRDRDIGGCRSQTQDAATKRGRVRAMVQATIAFFKFVSTLSRKPVVESHFWSAP